MLVRHALEILGSKPLKWLIFVNGAPDLRKVINNDFHLPQVMSVWKWLTTGWTYCYMYALQALPAEHGSLQCSASKKAPLTGRIASMWNLWEFHWRTSSLSVPYSRFWDRWSKLACFCMWGLTHFQPFANASVQTEKGLENGKERC